MLQTEIKSERDCCIIKLLLLAASKKMDNDFKQLKVFKKLRQFELNMKHSQTSIMSEWYNAQAPSLKPWGGLWEVPGRRIVIK